MPYGGVLLYLVCVECVGVWRVRGSGSGNLCANSYFGRRYIHGKLNREMPYGGVLLYLVCVECVGGVESAWECRECVGVWRVRGGCRGCGGR